MSYEISPDTAPEDVQKIILDNNTRRLRRKPKLCLDSNDAIKPVVSSDKNNEEKKIEKI
ncbi:hypothetical protein C1645_877804 [Glomus cerebriforme]|uniref:Uncharacterized protein n=1 Tax=Glomus cerebriforme TaxID=658196 RepID=A0A397SNP4_9GLOM|nr:hypothetical protein C1645_877804 [Glomus cerebriforme]